MNLIPHPGIVPGPPVTTILCTACGQSLRVGDDATHDCALSKPPAPRRNQPFSPGSVIAERYRMVARLGAGGMGEVYRADDLKLDQAVALKFLPESLQNDVLALARIRHEVRLSRQVTHPNVCRVFDLGETGGQVFISMEYVSGDDIASLLRRIGRLPVDKALEVAKQICAGLGAAHAAGVLHRDLKPANVMLDASGQVRITDFGLSTLTGEGSDFQAGTPAYMAPEQLAGSSASASSDLYALGLILYEIFSGRQVRDQRSVPKSGWLSKSATVTPPSHYLRGLDPRIERVILRCLAANPDQRPASALAIAAALPSVHELPVTVCATPGESSPAQVRSIQGAWLALAAAMVCLGIVLLFTPHNAGAGFAFHGSSSLSARDAWLRTFELTVFVALISLAYLVRRATPR